MNGICKYFEKGLCKLHKETEYDYQCEYRYSEFDNCEDYEESEN